MVAVAADLSHHGGRRGRYESRILRRILLRCKQKPRHGRGLRSYLLDFKSPAAVDREHPAATFVDPDTGTIPAPGAPLDACGLRGLPFQEGPASPADIDAAERVAIIFAAA